MPVSLMYSCIVTLHKGKSKEFEILVVLLFDNKPCIGLRAQSFLGLPKFESSEFLISLLVNGIVSYFTSNDLP